MKTNGLPGKWWTQWESKINMIWKRIYGRLNCIGYVNSLFPLRTVLTDAIFRFGYVRKHCFEVNNYIEKRNCIIHTILTKILYFVALASWIFSVAIIRSTIINERLCNSQWVKKFLPSKDSKISFGCTYFVKSYRIYFPKGSIETYKYKYINWRK